MWNQIDIQFLLKKPNMHDSHRLTLETRKSLSGFMRDASVPMLLFTP